MKLFHTPEKRRIICSGCEGAATQEGYFLSETDFENALANGLMIEDRKTQPLCKDCVTTLTQTMAKAWAHSRAGRNN